MTFAYIIVIVKVRVINENMRNRINKESMMGSRFKEWATSVICRNKRVKGARWFGISGQGKIDLDCCNGDANDISA